MAIDKILGNSDLNSVADSVFSAVSNSVSEVKAMQQRKAAENVQVVIEALRKIENDLRGEFSDVADNLAQRIASIKDGKDGYNGADGRAGKDGRLGRDGAIGPRGNDGLNGINGVDGQDGVSVTDAHIDFDGSLIITLSDGKLLNVGEVVSQDIAEKIKVIQTMSTNGAVGISDEGSSISTGVKNINFVGAAVTASASGDDVTVNVSSGTGTVTSVAVSGGTTGLTTSGGPITTTGTITLAGTLAVANGGTGITSFGSGVATFLGTPSSANLASAVSDETGTGALVFANSPTLVTPILGTPTSATLTNATGLPISTGVSGLGTDVATALAVNVGSSGAPLVNGGVLGTPSSGTVTNLTGTASININGTVGATTASSGAFTTVTASTPIGTASGGTGLGGATPFTANGVVFASSTSALSTGSGLTFDGTTLGNSTSGTPLSLNRTGAGTALIELKQSGTVGSYLGTSGSSDFIIFNGSAAELARFNGTGLGIGTSSPGTRLHASIASGTAYTTSSTGNVLTVANTTASGYAGIAFNTEPSAGNAGIAAINSFAPASGDAVLTFSTRSSSTLAERARIDSSGNFGIGQTPITSINSTAGTTIASSGYVQIQRSAANPFALARFGSSAGTISEFYYNTTSVGSISITASATAYNTSSDYRLKDNPQTLTGSGEFIDALKPKTWNWKVDGSKGVGFLAHEAQAVSPSSVSGQKDATDEEGKPIMQAMEYGSAEFIANIIAELQSLRKRVAVLEAK